MSEHPIYTIGYGRTPIHTFITTLKAHAIEYLIDVRSQPFSRHHPDYSQGNLTAHLAAAGIRYVYMGDTLGGRPTDPACLTNGDVDYDKVTQQPFYRQGIARLQDAHQQRRRVALMCAEARPEQCHRTHLIGRTLTALSIPVAHIDETGTPRTQADILARIQPPPPALPLSESPLPPPPPNFDDDMPYDDYLPADMPPPPDDLFFDDLPPTDLALAPPLTPPPVFRGRRDVGGAQKLLKQIFGYDAFRPLQAEIIDGILQGQDTLAVMPTGSGKSLCYQLPALMFDGLTVVVSPLISLMADQVMQLRELGVTAVALNSTLAPHEYQWTVQQIRSGAAKLLYAAPETLVQPRTLALLDQVRVDCLTIDEAHCISEWGHDFRPEYRQLTDVRRRLPDAVCLAVTATATEQVRQDIRQSLGISTGSEFIASFDRDNLHLAVAAKTDILAQTTTFLSQHRDESGIIYCATRRQVDELTTQLQHRGWQALPYHAGLDDATRRRHQELFSRDDIPVMVATVAFGMGINKSNVRFILHVDLPKNLESYYQQIGRAGRDGLPADCLLLYAYGDVNTIQYFISQQAPGQQPGARQRLNAMLAYVETNECRRRPLLAYFNESYTIGRCEMCDNCTTDTAELVDITVPAQKFLSCVKRTGELYGASHIIDVLRGSRNKRVLEKGHDQLSTYNIGGEFSRQVWQVLARQFVQQGLLVQDMEYGSLKLTSKAYAVFNGETVKGLLPVERATRETAVATPHDTVLFTQLRLKRKELADAANLPPYTIFSDRTLVEMATFLPQSRSSFAQLYGVGEMKLEKYADVFLPIIQAHCAANNLTEKPRLAAPASASRSSSSSGGRREEIVALWGNGRSLSDIARQLGIQEKTVVSHLWRAVQAGESLPPDGLLAYCAASAADQQRALAAFGQHGPDYLRPVYDALQESVSYDDLHLLRLYYVLTNTNQDA